MMTSAGAPVADNQNSLTATPFGPVLMPKTLGPDIMSIKEARIFWITMLAAISCFGVTVAGYASTTDCTRITELATAQVRSGISSSNLSDAVHKQEGCRVYIKYFCAAVITRQEIATCSQGLERKRNLDIVDQEISRVNDMIAAYCGD